MIINGKLVNMHRNTPLQARSLIADLVALYQCLTQFIAYINAFRMAVSNVQNHCISTHSVNAFVHQCAHLCIPVCAVPLADPAWRLQSLRHCSYPKRSAPKANSTFLWANATPVRMQPLLQLPLQAHLLVQLHQPCLVEHNAWRQAPLLLFPVKLQLTPDLHRRPLLLKMVHHPPLL